MASRPHFYLGSNQQFDTCVTTGNSTYRSNDSYQRSVEPHLSRSSLGYANADYQHLEQNDMNGNRLVRSSFKDDHNSTLNTRTNSCPSNANSDNWVLPNPAHQSSERFPEPRSGQVVKLERTIDECIRMLHRMKAKLLNVTESSNVRQNNQRECNRGLLRVTSIPTEYCHPDMVHDLAMLKGCIKELKNELRSTPFPKRSDDSDHESDSGRVPDVEISGKLIEINITCKNDIATASCHNSHSQPLTNLKKAGCVTVAPEITRINFDIGSAQVETITDKRILQAAENILLAKIDWSKDATMKALQAEKIKLERKMEKIACKKKIVEERINEERKMVERFVLRLEDRDHTLEDILDQIKGGALPDVVTRLLHNFNVRLLAVDCGLNFLFETTTGANYKSKLDQIKYTLGWLLPARKHNDAILNINGIWNYGLNPIPGLGMRSPFLETDGLEISRDYDYDEESLHPDYPTDSDTSQERIEWEYSRNASQSEDRVTGVRAERSSEPSTARRISGTLASQGRISDVSMPVDLVQYERYALQRGQEAKQSIQTRSAPNILLEFKDGASVQSVFIGESTYSRVDINRNDNARKSASGRSLHITITDREDPISNPDQPMSGAELDESPKRRVKKGVWNKIKGAFRRRKSTHR